MNKRRKQIKGERGGWNRYKWRKIKRRNRVACINVSTRLNVKASVAKLGEQTQNEDYSFVSDSCIVLSDGAGGCGLYADKWSQYLVDQMDKKKPVLSYEQLDSWVDGIWEPFYKQYEELAMQSDAMLLKKFYNEGSCATVVAAWITPQNECHWITYGDSVLFYYCRNTGKLWYSFGKLADFEQNPYLISSKDPMMPEGYKGGTFNVEAGSIIFAASDALSHFIMMMYQVSKWSEYKEQLEELLTEYSTTSAMIQVARAMNYDFYKDVLAPLLDRAKSNEAFEKHMWRLHNDDLLDHDDYTIAYIEVS
ncbi:hypothetical protein IX306_000932 [Porphyromonas levii]|uniref:hypothetical protein n=1 Tax=Porphyromonas levii TaxID=28114 RepID=UPI001BA80498|nr:hypothetical protein [Porphyromonas levii]MBR8773818.1 hypothetical protein [Porphyromonas levii]